MSEIIHLYVGGKANAPLFWTLLTTLEGIMAKIDDIKTDLAQTKTDLDAIKEAAILTAERDALKLKNATLRNAWEVESADRQATMERLAAAEAERYALKAQLEMALIEEAVRQVGHLHAVEQERDEAKAQLRKIVEASDHGLLVAYASSVRDLIEEASDLLAVQP